MYNLKEKLNKFVSDCTEWYAAFDERLTNYRILIDKKVRVIIKKATYKKRVIRFIDDLSIEFYQKHKEIFDLIENGEYSKEEYFILKNRIMSILKAKNNLRKKNILNELFAKEHIKRKIDSLRYYKRCNDGSNVITHAIYN